MTRMIAICLAAALVGCSEDHGEDTEKKRKSLRADNPNSLDIPTETGVADKDDLVFFCTVQDVILARTEPRSEKNWVVQCSVDEVVSAAFAGETFSFRVHSPSKMSIVKDGRYEVTAKRVENGYQFVGISGGGK